jgi:hypothetical protein
MEESVGFVGFCCVLWDLANELVQISVIVLSNFDPSKTNCVNVCPFLQDLIKPFESQGTLDLSSDNASGAMVTDCQSGAARN